MFRRRKSNRCKGDRDNLSEDTKTLTSICSSESSSLANRRSSGSKNNREVSTFRVKIPPNVRPGQTFQVYAGNRLIKLKCPQNATPGQSLVITLPKETANVSSSSSNRLHSSNVSPVPNSNPPAFMVTIPQHVQGGQSFPVTIHGVDLMITSPHNALPGMSVRIVPPKAKPPPQRTREKSNKGQLFEVKVPDGVKPGKPFALSANGIRISVKCPIDASPGQIVRFYLPFRTSGGQTSDFVVKKLNYDVDGWTRTLQISEMKFQWIRVHKNESIDEKNSQHNSIQKQILQIAYVTRLSEFEGLEFSPAQNGMVASSVISHKSGEVLATCTDLIAIQTLSLSDKMKSFHDICKKLGRSGHAKTPRICIQIRREFLLVDSLEAIMSLDKEELKHVWRIQFVGEEGVDAGGLRREWFHLISKMLLDPDSGLWMCCGGNQMNLQIHPSSALYCEDDLLLFRFLGRVLGKALFDQQLISGHMVQYLYKHLLGWPITFADLEYLDPVFYKSLNALMEMEDVEYACLDFTTSEETMGVVNTINLIPDGENVDVTQDNLVEYLESVLQYRLVKRVKNQMKELLLGFTEVIPESLLTIFDFQELELLMCGLPNIDVDDWMNNTCYSGLYNNSQKQVDLHEACQWFWEVVREMNEERRARLLQFVTGTSGVPAKGFSILQGNDGEVRLFSIHGVNIETCLYPRAHTCFNRIDLPAYKSKSDLEERLNLAITMVATGFDLE